MPSKYGNIVVLQDVRVQAPQNILQTSTIADSDMIENCEWDDERVFSDSEEENEYFQRVYASDPEMINLLNEQKSGKKKLIMEVEALYSCTSENILSAPLKCDKEIQCNMPIDKVQLSEIIKVCASLDIDASEEFFELIKTCRNILNSQENVKIVENNNENSKNLSETVQTEMVNPQENRFISPDFTPSRQSLTSDFLSDNHNNIVPSQANVDKNQTNKDANMNKLKFWKNRLSCNFYSDKKRRRSNKKSLYRSICERNDINLSNRLSKNSSNDNDNSLKRLSTNDINTTKRNLRSSKSPNYNSKGTTAKEPDTVNDSLRDKSNEDVSKQNELSGKKLPKNNLRDVNTKKLSKNSSSSETEISLRRSQRTGKPVNKFTDEISLFKNSRKTKEKGKVVKKAGKRNTQTPKVEILKKLVDDEPNRYSQFFKDLKKAKKSSKKSKNKNPSHSNNKQTEHFMNDLQADKRGFVLEEGVFKKPLEKSRRNTCIEHHNFLESLNSNLNFDGNVSTNKPTGKNFFRTLARSWMKNLCGSVIEKNDFSNISQESNCTSFQQQKSRRLYSPSQWLDSIDSEKQCEEVRRSQSIFRK